MLLSRGRSRSPKSEQAHPNFFFRAGEGEFSSLERKREGPEHPQVLKGFSNVFLLRARASEEKSPKEKDSASAYDV